MATKFVAAVALLALCHANPVLINGILYRDGRAYSVGQASSYGGGQSTAHAKAHGDAAQAFGSASGGAQLAPNVYYYPRQANAQAQTYDAPPFPESAYGAAKAVAQAHNGAYYQPITYEQNLAPAGSSVSHADSQGTGVAYSSANTEGGYGRISSNANTKGSGSADSHANSGSASSSAKSHGYGSAASSAQNNGVVGVVYPVAQPAEVFADQPEPAVVDLRTPIYYTSSVPAHGVASSNANVFGDGHAASSAKIGHGQGRTISWRFGTLYDAPASAHAQANAGHGAAKSAAHTHGYGVARSSANSQGGSGSANANAHLNSAGYGGARSTAGIHGGSGSANSQANSYGHGFANANALAA